MFLQLPAPERHEGAATAIKRIIASKIRMRTAHVAECNLAGGDTGIFGFYTFSRHKTDSALLVFL
jgi:hypothetical protein